MALITSYSPTVAGTAPTFSGAAAGDTAECGEGMVLIVKNTGASMTTTVATPGNLPTGDVYPDKVYTVAATTGEQWIPLLNDYRDPATGFAALTYSTTTSVTRAVIRF